MRKISRFQYAKWNSTPGGEEERSFGKLVDSIGPSLSGVRPVSSRRLINIDGPVAPALMRQRRRRNENEARPSRVQPCDFTRRWSTSILVIIHVRFAAELHLPNYRPREASPSIPRCKLNDYNRLNIWKSSNITSWLKITPRDWGSRPRSINKR